MNRRDFLASGGALVLAFSWRLGDAQGAKQSAAKIDAATPPPLPGSLKTAPLLDGWIRIDAKGQITVFTGKAELGQGIKTALIQVAAEELVVAPTAITLVTADTERTANEGYTAGSHSMQDSGTAIRHAAAQVREILLGIAAQKLGVPREQLTLGKGVVRAGSRSLHYGELVADETQGNVLHVSAAPQSVLRDPKTHFVMGKSLARVDIPAKVSGGSAYIQDVRIAGMVHGRVIRPPGANATLISIDGTRVEKMPGVLKVVQDGRFIAVIAQGEYQAINAMRALSAAAKWGERPTLPAQAQLYKTVRASRSEDYVVLDQGNAAAAGAKTLSASYQRPYQMHGSIGPSCAIAQLIDDKYTVWTHTQGVFPLRKALSELLGTSEPQVHCVHVEGAGCYGHNGADDVAADAALLARALPGRAVRVQWMREHEHGYEPLGPPMVSEAKATLDAAGSIVAWQYEVWTNPHSTRPGGAGDLLAGMLLARPFSPTTPKPIPQPEGGGDRNAIPLYTLPNARVVHHFLPDMPLRVSALRSLGAFHNVFSVESFMDELARAANADPVAFRLRHMQDARAQDVIRSAAQRFGWSTWKRQVGRGRGFAFARYKNLGAFLALACEVEVRRDTGEARIVRAVAAVDSGEAVNPDGIINQIEGGIVQATSWATMEEVAFSTTRVTSLDWGGYPILRFPQVPGSIEVIVMDRPGQPFLGTGEASQGPTAAAIANAVADATGIRVRQLPLSRAHLRTALGV